MKVFNKEVIICSKETRGNGVDTPIRIITEVFDKSGELIAEDDPYSLTIEGLMSFIEYRFKGEEQKTVSRWASMYFTED